MRKFRAAVLLIPILISGGQSTSESLDQYMDRQVHKTMKRLHLPALAITVVDDQNTLYENATGYADLERELEVNSTSIFKLWSVSKVFTAIEIFREVEEGMINLDDPISEYLPDFRIQSDFGEQDLITVRSLLAHQSGLPRNECLKVPVSEGQTGNLDRFEVGTWDCIKATPTGTRYKYSNLGYDLLGRIIEENRQTGYSEYMKTELFRSLGMDNSAFNSGDILDKYGIVLGYNYHKRKYYPMVQSEINSMPSGNMCASLEDLTVFLKAVFRGDVFTQESTLPEMFETHYSTKNNPETMGLGWKISRFGDSELLVWHDGGPGEGTGALIVLLPDRRLGIAMVANGTSFSGVESTQFAVRILERILLEGNKAGEESEPVKAKTNVDPELLGSYEGNYIAWGSVMEVKAKKRKLKGKMGGFKLALIPLNEGEFRVSHWMDRLGLTRIIRPPMDIKKIRVSFLPSDASGYGTMILNMGYFSYELCPRYQDNLVLPGSMNGLTGNYEMAYRLPYTKPGPMSGNTFSISLDDHVLTMSGFFGPIIPVDEEHLKILSGPFAGEIMEYDQASGHLVHQNGIFIPLNEN